MSTKRKEGIFPHEITNKNCVDTGMSMILILLIISLIVQNELYTKIAVPVLVINMIVPRLFQPMAYLWLGLSTLLGTIVSKILLSIIYFLVVLPVAILRKILGKDTLQLKAFKKESSSVMKIRNHTFTSKDLEKPY